MPGVSQHGEFRVPDPAQWATDNPPVQPPARVPGAAPRRDARPVGVDPDGDATPGPVVAAVALGVAPAALLGVYAVLFLLRGTVAPAEEPDITSSRGGETLAGAVALITAISLVVIVARTSAGRGPWPFVISQAIIVVGCAGLLIDSASGGRPISAVVGLVSVTALALTLVPISRRWFAAHAADRRPI